MKNRDGYALVAALWFLVLGSAISLDAAHAARRQRLLAAGLAEGARARFAAAAGLEHGRARLAARARLADAGTAAEIPILVDPWRDVQDLLTDTIELGRSRYHVAARDANAVLNVNRADEAQMRSLLLALRVDARLAGRIAQAVLDWRDADDFRRPEGAERDEYLRAGRPVLPSNGPFVTVDEVRHVLGMTDALFARLEPHIGTEGSGRINLNTAAAAVLAAVPGFTTEAVAVTLRERSRRRAFRNAQEFLSELSPAAREHIQQELPRFLSVASFETREVEVTSTGMADGSPVRVRAHAVFARAGDGTLITWRRTE